MKALVVRQPWAGDIATGIKRVEYRSWDTKHRGDLLIVAGKTWGDREEARERIAISSVSPHPELVNLFTLQGVALCVVELVSIRKTKRMYNWRLRNPRIVDHVSVKGQLHLFDVSLEQVNV